MKKYDVWRSSDGCLIALPSEDVSFDESALPDGKKAQDFHPVAFEVKADTQAKAIEWIINRNRAGSSG